MPESEKKQITHRSQSQRYPILTLVILLCLSLLVIVTQVANSSITFSEKQSLAIPNKENANKQKSNSKETWYTYTIKSGNTLAEFFYRLKIDYRQLTKVLALKETKPYLEKLNTKQKIHILVNEKHELQALNYEINRSETLMVKRDGDHFTAEISKKSVETELKYASGKIVSNFLAAGIKAGLSRDIIYQLPTIFSGIINFSRVHPGDTFSLLYQTKYIDGQKIGDGDIVAAIFNTRGHEYTAVQYKSSKGQSNYYTPQGKSLHKTFLRFPVHFKRISSRFTLRRWHPVLHRYRRHTGLDLAAYRGTPIHATSDGKIILRGRDGGYGNTVIIKHSAKISTLYAHMSEFARGLHIGSRVRKGQVIGYVGSTGIATGPHVHYEVRVYGNPRNPLTINLPRAKPINKKYFADFKDKAKQLLAVLNIYSSEG